MFSAMLDTKLDAKMAPFSMQLHNMQTQMECLGGQVEGLGSRIDFLEVNAEQPETTSGREELDVEEDGENAPQGTQTETTHGFGPTARPERLCKTNRRNAPF